MEELEQGIVRHAALEHGAPSIGLGIRCHELHAQHLTRTHEEIGVDVLKVVDRKVDHRIRDLRLALLGVHAALRGRGVHSLGDLVEQIERRSGRRTLADRDRELVHEAMKHGIETHGVLPVDAWIGRRRHVGRISTQHQELVLGIGLGSCRQCRCLDQGVWRRNRAEIEC